VNNSLTTITINLSKKKLYALAKNARHWILPLLVFVLMLVSAGYFIFYLQNGLGLAYNDARSHLDIGRRVVEGLKPGLAQLGSVWLPLPHLLMVPTIWNDFLWHSGLSGALQSMVSYVATGAFIFLFLEAMGVGIIGRLFGVLVFALNLNILYLQSTAMTELLLLLTLTATVYYLYLWHKKEQVLPLIKSAFFVMLATLIRYEGWFLLMYATGLIGLHTFRKKGYGATEGTIILFCTLGGLGIVLWLVWNQLIFKDALYFAFGPFSAHAQQQQLEQAGVLATKGNLWLSLKIYFYALVYNSGAFTAFIGFIGAILLWTDKRLPLHLRIASTALTAPYIFNVLALYLGHSVLFIQGLSGNTWFNVRYGVMMLPSLAIFMGYIVNRWKHLRYVIIGLFFMVSAFSFANADAVTIDDARVGSSQKNVSEVSGWLGEHAKDTPGFVLISAASHDAIIFSSGLPMKKFIHEGTGAYWESATLTPDRWARWIIMRTNDDNDLTWKAVKIAPGFDRYTLVQSFPFADIYEIKPEYVGQLTTQATLGKQK